ncbi:MAG: DUF4385 family protein [Candidatus Pacearchaeota archaeon]
MNFSKNTNYRKNPEKYWEIECQKTTYNELGVLRVEPYKREILPYWKFKTPEKAKESAEKIFEIYQKYKSKEDHVGMDMARKYLQMGYTRSMRYYYHSDGKKYDKKGDIRAYQYDEEKKKSANEFKKYFKKVIQDKDYKSMKEEKFQKYGKNE